MVLFKVDTKSLEEKKTRLYLFEFEDETGYYIKCGKSSGSSSEERLLYIITSYIKSSGGCCPSAKILRDVEVTNVFERENEFHKIFKERRHWPKHSVSGYTEMFSITKEEALEAFDRILDKEYAERSSVKECTKCKEVKSSIHFHTNVAKKDGLHNMCKTCTIEDKKSYKSLPNRMYANQVEHSKFRGHPRPRYTLEEFKEWLFTNPMYKELYDKYKASGYDKNLVPSVDRTDNSKGYDFDNITLVPFIENMRKNGEAIQKLSSKVVYIFDAFTGKLVSISPSINSLLLIEGINCVKSIGSKIDNVTKYGWLSVVAKRYQIVSKDNLNLFTDNETIKTEFRYKIEIYENTIRL